MLYWYSVLHVSFWCLRISSLYLQNANGPAAESLISFSDSVLFLVLPIAFGVLLYISFLIFSVFPYRTLSEHQALEFTWTVLPSLCLLLLAFPSLSLLYLLDEVGFPTSTTKVHGHQWYWHYENSDAFFSSYDAYISSGALRLLSTDSSLTIIPNIVLRFLISSSDVLHSWSLPAWGLKVDAVPGRLNQLSTFLERSGVFYGQCSEICGSNHSFMPIQAEVLPLANRPLL